MKTKFICVQPKSIKAKNRFANAMDCLHSCRVEQESDNGKMFHVYLRTLQFLDAESKRSELGGDQVTVAMLSTICPVPPFPSYTEQSSDKDMTQTLAEFVAQRDAQNTIELNIRKYTLMLCECLTDDFTRHHPNSDPYKFYIESGRKYHKIVMETESQSRSVHAFVDKKTGEVYKPASFKTPAKIVRYNLLMIESREEWLLCSC